MTVVRFMSDDFCRTCRGTGRCTEPDAHSYSGYRSIACFDCNGTGWRPGAMIDARTGEAIQ